MTACFIKRSTYPNVPSLVTLDFLPPKCTVISWGMACALRTSVPKTAINENGKPRFLEVEIRTARDIGRMFYPASNQSSAQDSLNGELGRAVADRTDCLHNFRTFLWGYRIRHYLSIVARTLTIARFFSRRVRSESGITFPPLIRIRSISGRSGD